jgi:hypothetical protein
VGVGENHKEMMTTDFTLIGFFPKKTQCPESFSENSPIVEICSVSEDISPGPDDWIDKWKHNTTWWLYDSEDVAWELTGSEREAYDMYAYKLCPVVFDGEKETQIVVESTAEGQLDGYQFLGYDMVSRSSDNAFECSPLSCNYGYKQYKVNRYCLVDEFEEALRITREIARDSKAKRSWEPGPYYLLEVYRKEKGRKG